MSLVVCWNGHTVGSMALLLDEIRCATFYINSSQLYSIIWRCPVASHTVFVRFEEGIACEGVHTVLSSCLDNCHPWKLSTNTCFWKLHRWFQGTTFLQKAPITSNLPADSHHSSPELMDRVLFCYWSLCVKLTSLHNPSPCLPQNPLESVTRANLGSLTWQPLCWSQTGQISLEANAAHTTSLSYSISLFHFGGGQYLRFTSLSSTWLIPNYQR